MGAFRQIDRMKQKGCKMLLRCLERVLPFVLISLSTTSLASPSFDCAQASSNAEQAICNDDSLATLDRRLNDRYRAAMAVARNLDAGSQEAVETLRTTQRGWIKGRDDCWKADDLKACITETYLIRETELVAYWLLEKPLAINSFTCEGNPANEVYVYFFDTERPGIRLEYGDSLRTGWRVSAGSGSKYATPFGGSFWQKGDEARFIWTEGEEVSCVKSR